MLSKVVLVIFDGLGDRPVPELSGKTPLAAARTPNLDALAVEAECGVSYTLGRGRVPGSDTAHLTLLGYDPEIYYCGRGPIEVAGLGLDLREGDVALRGNLATVENGVVRDRRAGRIDDVTPLAEALDGMVIDEVRFIVKPGTGHRAGVIMRGAGLSAAISDPDPHEPNLPIREVEPRDDSDEARRTARVLNAFLERAHEVLDEHPYNLQRRRDGKLVGNYLLVRGAGLQKQVPSFSERYGFTACCIAGGGLYRGVGAYLGMTLIDVPGATGKADTDIRAKLVHTRQALAEYDFIFTHIKATDSFSHDGDFQGKKQFIERIDEAAEELRQLPEEALLVLTADHSTPCALQEHSGDCVPILFRGNGLRVDDVAEYHERACARGGLGVLQGSDVMPLIRNALGQMPLIGA